MQKHENVICSRIEYEGEGQGKEKLIKIVDIVARYQEVEKVRMVCNVTIPQTQVLPFSAAGVLRRIQQ